MVIPPFLTREVLPRLRYATAAIAVTAVWGGALWVAWSLSIEEGRFAPIVPAVVFTSLVLANYVAARILASWLPRVTLVKALAIATFLHLSLVWVIACAPVCLTMAMSGVIHGSLWELLAGLLSAPIHYVDLTRNMLFARLIPFIAPLSAASVAILWLGARRAPGLPQLEPRLQRQES
jgi:hypothetical protein